MKGDARSQLYLVAVVCVASTAGWYVHSVTKQVNRELDGFAAYQAHLEVPIGEPHTDAVY